MDAIGIRKYIYEFRFPIGNLRLPYAMSLLSSPTTSSYSDKNILSTDKEIETHL